MVEQRLGLLIALGHCKIVPHHQDNVNVIRCGLGSDVAAKDDKTEKLSSCTGEFVDAYELGRDDLALRRAVAKAGEYLVKRCLVDADGQISLLIKFRQWHAFLPLRLS